MLSHPQRTGLVIKQLQVRHERRLNAALAPLDVTMVQWSALRLILRFPDASLHALAEENFQSDQAFGAVTARLVSRGLLERMDGPGKVVRHRLTSRGRALFDEGGALVDAVFTATFAALSPEEREEFDRVLDILHGHFEDQESTA